MADGQSPLALPPNHLWPRVRWRPEFWFALVPFLLGVISFFLPLVSTSRSLARLQLWIGLPLTFGPLLVFIGIWGWSAIATVSARARDYERLYYVAENRGNELDFLKSDVYRIAHAWGGEIPLHLMRGRIIDGKLYLSIARGAESPLGVDDQIVVIHLADRLTMGMFKIVQVRDADYYAVATSAVDPVWLGQVREVGESSMFPNMVAIPVPEGGQK